MEKPREVHGNNRLRALTDAEIRRSTIYAILMSVLIPPAAGSALAVLMGFYTLQEIFLVLASYSGIYAIVVNAIALVITPRIVRFVVNLPRLDVQSARATAQRVFTRLHWILLGGITLHTIGGPLSADFALAAMGVHQYSLQDHLYNQLCVIPIALISAFPIYFYFADRLGRYLGPRGILTTAIPLGTRLAILGVVTPLLIDTVLVNYYLNQTGRFEWQTLVLWGAPLLLAAGGTWLAWRSLHQGLAPLEAFVLTAHGTYPERAAANLVPMSLDELGILTERYGELLASQRRAENLANTVIDQAGALVVVLDRDGRIVRFNRAAEQLSGFTFAEVEGKYPWDTFLPPEDADVVRMSAFEALARNPQALAGHYTNRWMNRKGERFITEWTNKTLLDDQGRMQYVVAIGSEVTMRKEHDRGMDMLLAAAKYLEGAQGYVEVATILRDTVKNLAGYQNSWLFLVREEGRVVHMIGAKGDTVEDIGADSPLAVMEVENDPFLRRLVSATGLDVIADMRTDTSVDRARAAILDNRTTINVPLLVGGRQVGFYGTGTFGDEGVRLPSALQEQFLQSLASHVTAAIERIRSTRELRDNEERVRLALASANQGMFDFNIQTGEVVVSPEYATMLGYDPAEFHESMEFWLQRMHSEDRQSAYQAYSEYIAGKRSDYRIEFRQRKKNGGWVWILELGKILSRDAEGKPLRMLGTHTDITVKRIVENELRNFKRTLDQIKDCVFMFDPVTLKFTYVNQGAIEQVGYQYDEMLEMTPVDIKPDFDEPIFRKLIAPLTAGKQTSIFFETRHRHKSGHDIEVEIALQYVASIADSPRFVAIVRDISERKKTERELALHREHLEDLVNQRTQQLQEAQRIAHVGNWHLDLATQRVTWSDETFRIFGYEPGTVVPSQPLFEQSIHPDDRTTLQRNTRELFAGRSVEGLDFRLQLADGRLRWVHGEAAVTLNAEGKPVALTGTVHDITARKRVEQELITAKEAAEEANKTKNEFLSRMSHELRTPMNAILGFAQVLELEGLDVEQLDMVKDIHRAGDHLLDLINELLDLSRIESGKLALMSQAISISEVVDAALQIVHPLLQQRNVNVINHCTTANKVQADATRFKQILVNLLSNAAKYNREGGRITLTCTPAGDDRIRLSVTDTGNGIAPENLSRLFKVFERLGAEFGPVEGVGIGLALSKQLAELMNGSLGVDSKPGQGSTFWIELPLAQSAERDTLSSAKDNAKVTPTNRTNVLYVEDNPANLRVVEAMFKHQPHLQLISASNGEFGLELAKRYRPDVILLDIHLPGMDGYAVLNALKDDAQTKNIPVIALSADAMPLDIDTAIKAGFDKYLTKPIKTEALIEALDNVLRQHR